MGVKMRGTKATEGNWESATLYKVTHGILSCCRELGARLVRKQVHNGKKKEMAALQAYKIKYMLYCKSVKNRDT